MPKLLVKPKKPKKVKEKAVRTDFWDSHYDFDPTDVKPRSLVKKGANRTSFKPGNKMSKGGPRIFKEPHVAKVKIEKAVWLKFTSMFPRKAAEIVRNFVQEATMGRPVMIMKLAVPKPNTRKRKKKTEETIKPETDEIQ